MKKDLMPHPQDDSMAQAVLILKSFRRALGRDLLPLQGSPEEISQALFEAPFVVVSHGVEADPILNYGNRAALQLWEMSWEELTGTPSRLTAEPVNREERARLLAEVTQKGFIENYQGVRISKTGRRFRIEQATVWNLVDDQWQKRGQAATFSYWVYLDEK